MDLFIDAKEKGKKDGIIKCLQCGSEFKPDNRNVARGWGHFCSKSCAVSFKNKVLKLKKSSNKRDKNKLKAIQREYKLRQLGIND